MTNLATSLLSEPATLPFSSCSVLVLTNADQLPIFGDFFGQSQPSTSFLFRYLSALYYTSFWPCLRHRLLASSLPLPPAQAIACWGCCPQTPFLHNNLILYFNIVSMVFSISNQQILLFIILTA
jgi:hypothetical protein